MSVELNGHELRIERGGCPKCGADVAFLPPCSCGHGSLGRCRRGSCRLVVVEAATYGPDSDQPEAVDAHVEELDAMIAKIPDSLIAGPL